VEVRAVFSGSNADDSGSALGAVRQAFFDGDFERALVLCDEIASEDGATRIEIALLRARILIRLDRADRAVELLKSQDFSCLATDQRTTAAMLLAAAYVRLGRVRQGAVLLSELMDRPGDLHPTIRAELALNLGIAWYRLGDYEEAVRLLAEVPASADIIHARALEYTGWVAFARGDSAGAAHAFQATLKALRNTTHADRYVEANALYALAMLVPELLLVPDWATLEPWLRRFNWSVSGVVTLRFWTLVASAVMLEVLGDTPGARDAARAAEETTVSAALRVVALCRLAAIFRGVGEMQAHAEFLARAQRIYDGLDVRDHSDGLRLLPLDLAEECIYAGRVDDAAALLLRFREAVAPESPQHGREAERSSATADYVEAAIRYVRGDHHGAMLLFSSSFRTFADHGYRRRAAALALKLFRLTGEKRYERYAADALRDVHPSYWMARELAALRGADVPALTRTESEILAMVVHGRTYKEIAAARGVSWKTVGHHVQALFRKFGVRSRGELAAEALRRRAASVEARRTASA
jgi:DNA-binding CsgD family transcriptional regulator